MKKFLADLFAGRLSFYATMALGALPVTALFIYVSFPSGTFGPPLLLMLLLTLGFLLTSVAIWRSAINFPSETDKIGAMGCAILMFMMSFVVFLFLSFLWIVPDAFWILILIGA